ncbi:hypothetical protein IJT17_04305 [bacterium]|nr:hypothetical protein [bacterium]
MSECKQDNSNNANAGKCICGKKQQGCKLCPAILVILAVAIIGIAFIVFGEGGKQPVPPSSTPPTSAAPPAPAAPEASPLHSEDNIDFRSDNIIRPVDTNTQDPRALRQQGDFARALQILDEQYRSNPTAEDATEMLGIIEDMGDSLRLISQSREYAKVYPDSMAIKWELAKGLLFAAATFRNDPRYSKDYPNWLNEAEEQIRELEKSDFSPQETRGYLPILKAELAFMREQWDDADKYAREGLRLGTTAGETGDLYSMLFDIACRRGKKDEASQYLDQALQVVAKASAHSYYGLRMFREEALIVKDFVLDQQFTEDELNKMWEVHEAMLKAGYVDPTSPDDSEATDLHQALHQYAAKREAKDYAACLNIIQGFIDNKPNHTPRCFFSEAVMSPLRPYYLNIAAGKLCSKMGDKEKAQAYFDEALAAHPGDAIVKEQLDLLNSPTDTQQE